MFKLVVLAALFAVTTAHVIAPAAQVLTKTVHYESAPVITGHSETILKPKLEYPAVETAIISEPSHVEVHEPAVARVGEIVESVPTAVSHQSSTVVHSRAKIVTPIVAPVVKTHIAPLVKTYAAPLLTAPHHVPAPIFKTYESAPILKTFEEAPILKTIEAPAPILKTIEETPILKTFETAAAPILKSFGEASILKTFEHSPILKTYGVPAPLHYSAPVLTKTVHYGTEPVVTGYSESILKPKLDATIYSTGPAFAYAARPELALAKEIHYSSEPIVTGYNTEILKPKLESGHYVADNEFPYPPASAPAW